MNCNGFASRRLLAAAAAFAFLPAASWAGTQPVAGDYEVSSYLVSATGTCTVPAGTYLSSVYVYPGPGKRGATARVFLNGPSGNFIEILALPVTPAAGATSFSGPYTQTFLPGGTPASGTVSATIQYIDAQSFVDTATYTITVNGQKCVTVAQEAHVFVK